MKACVSCNQVYNDPTFFFCLTDGNPLRDLSAAEETLVLPSASSIVTVVNRPGVTQDSPFEEKYVFEDEEMVLGELQLKMISSDEDNVVMGFKITVRNVAPGTRTVYVTLNAVDSDGFKVDSVTLGGNKLKAGETRTFTEKEQYDLDHFRGLSAWSIEEVSSYEV